MLFCFSVNHHHAPLNVREQLTVTPERWAHYLNHKPERIEAIHLTTCNRIELYLEAPDQDAATTEWRRLMGSRTEAANAVAEAYANNDVGYHLFRVAAGLDSVVLGEPEILGQVRRAYEAALEGDTAGPRLAMLFRAAIHSAKRIRTETSLSEGSVSFIALAMRRIEQWAGAEVRDLRIAVVGAGEMGRAVLSALASRGARRVTVISRTLERAQATAAEFGYSARPFAGLSQAIAGADALFSATAATNPIITPALLDGSGSARLHLVDLAVPRDIAPEVTDIDGIILLNLEDLEHGITRTRTERQAAAEAGEAILLEELVGFMADYHARAVAPTITEMRQWADEIRQAELKRIINRLPRDHKDYDAYLEEFSYRLMNKLLHHPTVSLRKNAADPEFESVIRNLFGLDTYD